MPRQLLYVISLMALSTSPIFTRSSGISVDSLGFWRLLIAAAIMWPVAFWQRREDKNLSISQQPPLSFEQKALLQTPWTKIWSSSSWALFSGVFFFLHLWTYFYAAHHTKIANAVVIYATNPLFTSIVAYFVFRERFTWRLFSAYFLAGTGLFLLVAENLSSSPELLLGNLSALASAGLFAIYLTSGKLARLDLNNSHYAAIKYSVATVCFFLSAQFFKVPLLAMPLSGWLAALGMVLVPTFLGHFLFSYLMKFMNLNLMTCGKLAEPVFSALLAYWIFSETLSSMTLVAFVLTGASILTLFWKRTRSEPASED